MARPRSIKGKRGDLAAGGSAQDGPSRMRVVSFRRTTLDEPLAEREWLGMSQNEIARRDLERYYALIAVVGRTCPAKMTEAAWNAVDEALGDLDFKDPAMLPRASTLLSGEPGVPRPLIEWAHGNPFACAWIVDMVERRRVGRVHAVKKGGKG